ncbi:hypothetical protein CRYUN_Cryun28dG0027800 [Craigia yunnanensis]
MPQYFDVLYFIRRRMVPESDHYACLNIQRFKNVKFPECKGSKQLSQQAPALQFQVMFICNHCPFVKHLKKDIVKLSNFYMKKGLAVVAISSNSVATHPQDGPQFMAEEAKLLIILSFILMRLKMLQEILELFVHQSFFYLKRQPALNQVGNDRKAVCHAMKI